MGAAFLRVAVFMETQHFFSKGHYTLERSLKKSSASLNLEGLLMQSSIYVQGYDNYVCSPALVAQFGKAPTI
jgi:hypothetical protein